MALKLSNNEYNLILQNDINTKGNTQWFYFRVSNTTKDLKVKFNIINFSKPGSLYNSGMKVMINSNNSNWFRGGEDILYFPNGVKKNKKGKSYYTMSFAYSFINDNDTVYFAYSCPYTFTDLMKYLQSIEDDAERRKLIKRRLLTHSIAGNRCDYLTITSVGNPDEMKKRKGIFISARVHPGETVGS
jgi:Zinc carboxypeptidase.